MATKFITPSWRMPKNSNQSKASNYSIEFDGSSYISLPSSLDLGTNSTISLWFKSDSGNANHTILGEDSYQFDYLLQIASASDEAAIRIGSVYKIFTVTEINDGNWNHWCIVRNGDSVELFINNSSKGTQTGYGTGTNTKFEKIGAEGDNQFPITGKVAQLSAFDYTLTGNAVTALYNSGIPANPLAVTTPPVAYYDLGQGSAYASGSAGIVEPNLAAATGSTVFEFDALDVVESPHISIDSSFTVSAWINTTDTQTYGNIFSPDNFGPIRNWQFFRWNNTLRFLLRDSSNSAIYDSLATATETINDGKWHHVAATWDGTTDSNGISIYIDGELSTQGNSSSTALSNRVVTQKIGSSNVTWDFIGEISNCQLWNTDLSNNEITTLYNNGTPLQLNIPQSGSLKAWYKLGLDTSNWDGNNWTLSNSSANYSNSLQFNGTSNYITTPSFTTSGDDLTISVWLKAVNLSSGTSDILFGNNSNFIRYNLNEVIYARINGVDAYLIANSSGVPQIFGTGNWHHLAVVKSGSTVTWYIDGNPYTTLGSGTTGGFTMNYIGANGSALNEFLDGQLSNVAIFESALDALAITTLYNSGQPETTISSSPLSWWKLDNLTTGIQDLGSAFNNGTNNGATVTDIQVSTLNGISSGMDSTNLVPSNLIKSIPYSGYSMDFDGAASSDYIDCGTISSIPSATKLSVSFWANTNSTSQNQVVFGDNSATPIFSFEYWGSNDRMYFEYGTGLYAYLTLTSVVTAGSWHNVVLVYDASGAGDTDKIKIYVDSVDKSSSLTYTGTIPASLNASIGDFWIGNGQNYNVPFNGYISNVAIWDRAITEDEILRVYNGGSPSDLNSLGPTGWWSLGADSYFDGVDWICPDLSTNSNNGTSFNMPNTALVGDGPDSLANGTSTNLDLSSNLIGEAPGSTGNAISINMNSLARTGSTP